MYTYYIIYDNDIRYYIHHNMIHISQVPFCNTCLLYKIRIRLIKGNKDYIYYQDENNRYDIKKKDIKSICDKDINNKPSIY